MKCFIIHVISITLVIAAAAKTSCQFPWVHNDEGAALEKLSIQDLQELQSWCQSTTQLSDDEREGLSELINSVLVHREHTQAVTTQRALVRAFTGQNTLAVGSNYQELVGATNTTVVGADATVLGENAYNRTALGAHAQAVVDNGIVLGDQNTICIYPGGNAITELGYPPHNIFNTVNATEYRAYNGNNYAALAAPQTGYTATYTLYLPVNPPASYQPLVTDGSGTLTFITTQTSCDIPFLLIARDSDGSFVATTLTLTGNPMVLYTADGVTAPFIPAPITYNTFIGLLAGTSVGVTGTGSVALGYSALPTNTTILAPDGALIPLIPTGGYKNIAIGPFALYNTNGFYLPTIQFGGGNDNIGIGVSAVAGNITVSKNIGIGTEALLKANTFGPSTAIGYQSMVNYTGAPESTASISNIAIGSQALATLIGTNLASYNTVLGHQADVDSPNATQRTALGAQTQAGVDFGTVIGNSAVTTIYPGNNKTATIGSAPKNLFNTVQATALSFYDSTDTTCATIAAPDAYTLTYTLFLPASNGPLQASLVTDGNNPGQLHYINFGAITTGTSFDIPNTAALRDQTGSFAVTSIALTPPVAGAAQVTLQAASNTSTYTIQMPINYGLAGQYLATDGNETAQLAWLAIDNLTTLTIQLYGDVIGSSTATTVATVCGIAACDLASMVSTVTTATSAAIPSTLALRDSTGSFSTQILTLFGNPLMTYTSQQGALPVLQAPAQGNTSIGLYSADTSNGLDNTAVGYYALAANLSGTNNVAYGYYALTTPQASFANTAIGFKALADLYEGSYYNTGIGYNALANGAGYYNTAVGAAALSTIFTGSHNLFIGNNTSLGVDTTALYRTALGDNATALVDYGMVLGGQQIQAIYPGSSGQADLGTPGNGWATLHTLTAAVYSASGYYAGLAAPIEVGENYTLLLPTNTGAAGNALAADGNNPAHLYWTAYNPAIFTGNLYGDVQGIQQATQVALVCGVPACALAATYATVASATSINLPDSLALRDGNGSFQTTNLTLTGQLILAYNGNTVSLEAASGVYTYTLQLPTAAGSQGQVLVSNGAGATAWQYLFAITSTRTLYGDVIGSTTASVVATICGIPACTLVTTITTATSAAVPRTLALRDSSGSISTSTLVLDASLIFAADNQTITLEAVQNSVGYTLALPTGVGLAEQILTITAHGTALLWQSFIGTVTPIIQLYGDIIGSSSATIIQSICGQNACELANIVITATSADIQNSLVLRDATGSFAATTLTLTGQSLIAYDTQGGYIYAPVYNNALIGLGAGNNGTLTGTAHVAFGTGALAQVTTQHSNVAIGYNTLSGASILSDNIAIGVNGLASPSNNAGAQLAIGSNALAANTTGTYNSAIGYSALAANTSGAYNLALGPLALAHVAAQSDNIAIGYNTLSGASILSDNIAIGVNALASPSNSAGAQLAIGSNALAANTIGTHNSAIGYGALAANTSGAYNLALGPLALANPAAQSNNIAIGYNTLSGATQNDNIAIGVNALASPGNNIGAQLAIGSNALAVNSTEIPNVAIGYNALAETAFADQNTAVGCGAMGTGYPIYATSFGAFTIPDAGTIENPITAPLAVGAYAGQNFLHSLNMAIGYNAQGSSQHSQNDVVTSIGAYAGAAGLGATDVAVGWSALSQGSGGNNTCLGAQALMTAGYHNVAIGYNAFGGQYNSIAIGAGAGIGPSTSSASFNNITIGAGVGSSSGGFGVNNIYIGNANTGSVQGNNSNTYVGWTEAGLTENATIRIGSLSGQAAACYIAGVGNSLAVSGPAVVVNSNNQLGVQPSSVRYKENIKPLDAISPVIYQFRPVQFVYKHDSEKVVQAGLIAEEVAEVFPEIVVFNKDGQPETIRYQHLPFLMLAEQQKDHALLVAHDKILADLPQRLAQLEAKIELLTPHAS